MNCPGANCPVTRFRKDWIIVQITFFQQSNLCSVASVHNQFSILWYQFTIVLAIAVIDPKRSGICVENSKQVCGMNIK